MDGELIEKFLQVSVVVTEDEVGSDLSGVEKFQPKVNHLVGHTGSGMEQVAENPQILRLEFIAQVLQPLQSGLVDQAGDGQPMVLEGFRFA